MNKTLLEVERIMLQIIRQVVDVCLLLGEYSIDANPVPNNKRKKLRLALPKISLPSLSPPRVHDVLDKITLDCDVGGREILHQIVDCIFVVLDVLGMFDEYCHFLTNSVTKLSACSYKCLVGPEKTSPLTLHLDWALPVGRDIAMLKRALDLTTTHAGELCTITPPTWRFPVIASISATIKASARAVFVPVRTFADELLLHLQPSVMYPAQSLLLALDLDELGDQLEKIRFLK